MESPPAPSPTQPVTQDLAEGPRRARIEQYGVDVIPDADRRGRPRQLGAMWTGVVLNVLTVVYGALLVSFGLSLWQCIAAILIGNLSWLVAGLASLPGPRHGTTTFTVNRSIMGNIGNRFITACNWLMQIGYEVLDMVLMTLAATALLGLAGVQVGAAAQVGLVLVFSVVQTALPVLGHAAITRVLNVLAAPFAVVFLLLAWLTAARFEYTEVAPAPLTTFLGAVALVASAGGLGWSPNATDMSRYLPRSTSPGRLVAAVALGGDIPQSLLMILGSCVAFVTVSATDPISGLDGAYPTWFVVPYLVLLLVQMASLNGLNVYSSGLTLQAAGVPLNRWQAVVLDSVVCAVLASIVVTSGSFYAAVTNFLLFSLVWFTPWVAVYVVAHALRHTDDLGAVRPRSSTAGVAAQLVGMLAAASCLVTSVWSGWVATWAGSLDLSIPAGLLVAGGTYALLSRRTTAA